jgi:phage tail sheath protein FI
LSPGVYVQEVESGSRPIEGVGTAVAAFVGVASSGPFHTPTQLTNWTQFTTTFGGFTEGSYLAHAVYGYFMNGGGVCFVVRIGEDGTGGSASSAQLTSGAHAALGGFEVRALEQSTASNGIVVEVAPATGEAPAPDAFTLLVRTADGAVVESYENVSVKKGRQNVASVVKAQSKVIELVEPTTASQLERPADGTVVLAGATDPLPTTIGADDYIGNAADRTGFSGLEAVDEVTMVCVPDLLAAYQQGLIDLDAVQAVQLAMIAHCELMGDRMAVLDPPPGLNAQQIREWRVGKAGYDSKYAALYWPWVKVLDPMSGGTISVPPSGHVAGIWGRNDDTRGVHKAPANEVVRGALAPDLQITKPEQDLLNPVGINCIRFFPGRGVRVWGARTLSSDPAWRYINVRRLFIYLEESIMTGTQWVVFEPNDETLWAKMRRTVNAFLTNEWRRGALFGLTPDEAFYVKCDSETNPSEGIDAGQVVCQIGVAPVKPAEFVVFQLAQFSGGSSLVAE